MKSRIITIQNPVGGVVRKLGFQQQAPFSCQDALGFWPVDSKTSRQRLAIRPRFATFANDPNAGSPILCLAEVNTATNQTLVRGLFMIQAGKLYRYAAGAWVDEGGTFATTYSIQAAGFLDKLYIADGAAPTVYDATADTRTTLTATAGSIPANCRFIAFWRDRLVLAGDASNPHVWYMSRAGTPTDFDYTDTDATAAVSGTTMTSGLIGEKLTALISHNKECIMFGGTDSLHIMRGDPMQSGRLEVLSHVIGPVGPFAHCKTADESTVMLTRNGIYVMQGQCGSTPVPYSRNKIPDSLLAIDRTVHEVFLEYDTRFNGVHVYKSKISGTTGDEAWWLDWENGGFWPLGLAAAEQPKAILRFDPLDDSDVSGVLIGSTSGGVRRFDRTSTTSLASGYVRIGPIRISPTPFHNAQITELRIKFGSNTDATHATTGGVVKIYTDKDAESVAIAAAAGTAARKFEIKLGALNTNTICHPHVSGHAAIIEIALGSDGTKHISVEEIAMVVREEGFLR